MTIEAWVFPTWLDGRRAPVAFKENQERRGRGLRALRLQQQRPLATRGRDPEGVHEPQRPARAYRPGTWSHVAATYDGATLRLFHDGVEVGSETGSPLGSVLSGGDPLKVGGGERDLGGSGSRAGSTSSGSGAPRGAPSQLQQSMNAAILLRREVRGGADGAPGLLAFSRRARARRRPDRSRSGAARSRGRWRGGPRGRLVMAGKWSRGGSRRPRGSPAEGAGATLVEAAGKRALSSSPQALPTLYR